MWAARPSNNPEILVPVVAVPPDLLNVELDASTEINRRVLLAHAPFFIMRKGLVRSAVVAHVVEAPLDEDEVFVLDRRRTPVPVVLMAGVGGRQAVTRPPEVDSAGFTVIAGPDAGFGALVRRDGSIDLSYLADQLRPAELVGGRLRPKTLHVNFGLRRLEAEGGLVTEVLVGREHPRCERHRRQRAKNDHGGDGCLQPKAFPRPALDGNRSSREDKGINGKQIIVLGVQDLHGHEKDNEDYAQQSPAALAQKPECSEQPDGKEDWVHHQDLLFDERERRQHDVFAFAADVLQVFERGEVALDLPD